MCPAENRLMLLCETIRRQFCRSCRRSTCSDVIVLTCLFCLCLFSNVVSAAPPYRWENVTHDARFKPRDGAGAIVYEGQMWLLGGWNPRDKEFFPRICNNEVWSSRDGATWSLVKPNTFRDKSFDSAADWEGRHYAGYVVHRDRMWIVGGDVNQGHYHFDVWNSTTGRDWSHVNRGRPIPWKPRAFGYTVAFKDRIWVMGGQTIPQMAAAEPMYHRDIWTTADGVEWEQVEPEGTYWSARALIGGQAVFQDRIWVLGGGLYDTPGTERTFHNDVWYSADGVEWNELPDTPWESRHAASVFIHDNSLWLVAGNNMQPDVWRLRRAE